MASHGEPTGLDLPDLVGRDGWARLSPAIRTRFTTTPPVDRPMVFHGTMHRVERSFAGALLAPLCRLLGTPFAPIGGRDVPTTIELRAAGDHRIEWWRQYRFAGRAPVLASSFKHLEDGMLSECTSCGVGVELAVFEANRALHFLSLNYYWRVGRRPWRLPKWLSLGTAHVVHADAGNSGFRFTMTIHHPLLGRLFHHDGVFTPAGEGA